jgi:peptidoglycan hydrolase CwlO-like protein
MNETEVRKINDLYKQLDEKDLKLQSVENNLVTAQNTVNFLNSTVETFNEKFDKLTLAVDTLTKKCLAKK